MVGSKRRTHPTELKCGYQDRNDATSLLYARTPYWHRQYQMDIQKQILALSTMALVGQGGI